LTEQKSLTSRIITNFKSNLKEYPWDFMGFLVLALLIPRIYSLINTMWIGHIDYSSLAIAEQYEFMGILIEIVNEGVPFGVLALVSQNYKNRSVVLKQLFAGIILQLILSTTLSIIILSNMPLFVQIIGTSAEIVDKTIRYLSLRAIALPFNSLALLLIIGIKSLDRAKLSLEIVSVNVLLNIILDLFLISNFPFSLQLGLDGAAIGYLISNITYFITALGAIVVILHIKRQELKSQDFLDNSKSLFKVGGWTGIDSFVRNFFYFFVLQILNFMGPNQFAGFQLFQKIMWTVLIPVIAISEGTAIRVGNYLVKEDTKKRIPSLLTTSAFLGFMIVGSFGLVGIFAIDSIGSIFTSNLDVIRFSSLMFFWQIIPYILFAVAMNLRGLFFGTGKTYNILIISLILNLGVIFPFFLLINSGILPQNFESIMLMFVFVDLIDIVITYILIRLLLNRLYS